MTGKRLDPPLQEWADNGGATLLKEKNYVLVSMPPRRTEQFESFGRWIVSMQKMFLDGLHAHASYLLDLSVAGSQISSPIHFANDTLDGFVTFDKLQKILDTKLL